jgi:hypothetical protein
MGSDHISLLLHTEIWRLSRGELLSRVYELHDELRIFLISHNYEYATLLINCRTLEYRSQEVRWIFPYLWWRMELDSWSLQC